MKCIRSFALALSPLLVASSITAFTAKPALWGAQTQRSSSLLFSTSTSAEFELPEEGPERRNSRDSRTPEAESVVSEVRRLRYQREEQAKKRFVSGDELHVLRQEVLGLREKLTEARKLGATGRVQELEMAIIEAQQVDAEFVYSVAKERMGVALEAGLHEEAREWEKEATMARSVLPQFNLEGLWVGKYGDHGFEMINVTYVGDTLVAHKVTGKKNVPQGQVTFQVDLSVSPSDDNKQLEPIELGESAAKQWGSKFLKRFAGQGQVAAEGYRNSQWMEGHLILVNEYFSFAWLPIGHQVFFGRPSPELTLKLLRESKYGNSDDNIREYLTKCLEETESLEDEMEVQDSPFNSHDQQDYYNQEGCFE
mgnify:CR=1 FL=1